MRTEASPTQCLRSAVLDVIWQIGNGMRVLVSEHTTVLEDHQLHKAAHALVMNPGRALVCRQWSGTYTNRQHPGLASPQLGVQAAFIGRVRDDQLGANLATTFRVVAPARHSRLPAANPSTARCKQILVSPEPHARIAPTWGLGGWPPRP